MKEEWINIVVSKVVMAVYVAPGTGKNVHRNRPYHGLVLNDESSEKDYIFADGKVLHTYGGNLFYLPEGTTYRVIHKKMGGCYAVNFKAELSGDPFSISIRNRDAILKYFKSAERYWYHPSETSHVGMLEALYGIIHTMGKELKRAYLPNSRTALLAPAVEKMSVDFKDNSLTVSPLADLCGISETYFRRIFMNVFGVTPKEYIINLRIDYAKRLLESDQFSVSEIAVLCGYAEPCHFSREFTKRVGTPPNKY